MNMHRLTLARRIYSFARGVAGCSRESKRSVSGDAVSRRLSNFEMRSRLCVLLWDKLTGAMALGCMLRKA